MAEWRDRGRGWLRGVLHRLGHRQHTWQARAFGRASLAPQTFQAARLAKLLAANADSVYGRAHRFGALGSVEEFQRRVPLVDAEVLRPYLERAAQGEPRVLTCEPIRFFETTSGSTGGRKLLPFTASMLNELRLGIAPWLAAVFAQHPGLYGAQQYWSVSPVGPRRARTPGGHRVGASEDTEYVGLIARWATRQTLAVPPEVALEVDPPTWRAKTLRQLVRSRALGLISVWSPSFLTLLMSELEHHLPEYLRVLPPGERHEVEARLERDGRLTGEALWPGLVLISCWMDAGAAHQVPALRAFFPKTRFQPKGLLATEGMVSFPLGDDDQTAEEQAPVVAAAGHFLEFVDLASREARPRLVHELVEGAEYLPVLTTGAGLVRCQLPDVVRCVGRYRALPRLRFLGRADRTSDLCGEKLVAHEVEVALGAVARQLGQTPAFALLTPEPGTPAGYRLYLELPRQPGDSAELLHTQAKGFAARLDQALEANPQYAYARRVGQLRPMEVRCVEDGWARYLAELVRRGMRAGDVKPTALELRPGWEPVFAAPALLPLPGSC